MSIDETIEKVVGAANWDQRVAQIRLIPQHHGTIDHQQIYAEIARRAYVPYLAPDFAYIHDAPFYGVAYFTEVYESAHSLTDGFAETNTDRLAAVIQQDPRTLLVFRTIMGLAREEFAHSTDPVGLLRDARGRPPARWS